MAKKKVVVKRLISVEDFGNIDTLCMDKTGTLTEGKLSLEDCLDIDGKHDESLFQYCLLATNVSKDNARNFIKDPIDQAIWQSIFAQKYKRKISSYKILDINEFDYERRRMSILFKSQDDTFLVCKGATESVLDVCSRFLKNKKTTRLKPENKKKFLAFVKNYEQKGSRVLGLAIKNMKKEISTKNDEEEMCFLGYLLFRDPVKKNVHEALQRFNQLGVNLKIIS